MIDRSEVNRALAKAIAYKACGKDAEAALWAAELIHLLECASILREESVMTDRIRAHAGNSGVLPSRYA